MQKKILLGKLSHFVIWMTSLACFSVLFSIKSLNFLWALLKAAHLLEFFLDMSLFFLLVRSNSSRKSPCFCSKSWSYFSKSEISSSAPLICFSNYSFCKSKCECRSLRSAVFRSRSFWSLEKERFKTWHSWQKKVEGLTSVFGFWGQVQTLSWFWKNKTFGISVFYAFTVLFEFNISIVCKFLVKCFYVCLHGSRVWRSKGFQSFQQLILCLRDGWLGSSFFQTKHNFICGFG